MKTIKDLAEAANVSKTSIYNLIKKNNITTFKKNGVTYIDDQGENLIVAYYSSDQQETLNDMLDDSKHDPNEEHFQEIQDTPNSYILNIFETQIAEKDRTIQALINVISHDKNYQTARLLADFNKPKESFTVQPSKKSFFKRIFG